MVVLTILSNISNDKAVNAARHGDMKAADDANKKGLGLVVFAIILAALAIATIMGIPLQ